MFIKYGKIAFLFLILMTIFVTYDVKAKELKIDGPVQIEKQFANTGLSTCKDVLGDAENDENSVAWLIQRLLNYIKILGPMIAIVLGSIDFAKAIITSDEENMKKAQTKFVYRLIAALLLFFVPFLTQILLGLFGITADNANCGLK